MSRPLEGKSILVVDDDPEIREAIKIAFDDTGADIQMAADGNLALEAAETYQPDLVVLDAMLPKRSGFLVLEKLKARRDAPKPRVIMITGNQGSRHKAWAQSLGVDEYLNKPFRMERLMEITDRLLND